MGSIDGLSDFVTPSKASEFEELVHYIRANFNAMAGQSEVVAHDLRRLLPRARNVQGRAGWMGLDLRAAAWQVARQFQQVAAAQRSAAAASTKALTVFHGNFVAPPSSHARGFDAGA